MCQLILLVIISNHTLQPGRSSRTAKLTSRLRARLAGTLPRFGASIAGFPGLPLGCWVPDWNTGGAIMGSAYSSAEYYSVSLRRWTDTFTESQLLLAIRS